MRLDRRSASFAVTCVALVSSIAAVGLGTDASADEPQAPLMLQGTIAGATDLQADDLLIQIEPDQAWIDANVEPGGSIHESTVPASSITTDGADYEVRLDPSSIPAQDITQYGLVRLTVSAQDEGGEAYGTQVVSIRAVLLPDGSYAWVDPGDPVQIVSTPESATPRAALRTYRAGSGHAGRFHPTRVWARKSTPPVTLDVTRFDGTGSLRGAIGAAEVDTETDVARGASSRDDDGTAVATQLIDDPMYDASKCQPGPGGNGAGVRRGATRKVMTTIGTSFPVEKDTAKMVFDDTNSSSTAFDAKMASAVEDGIGPIVESSKLTAMDKKWGFDWDFAGYNRAYQVQQVYQHVSDWGDRCPGDPLGPYFQSWEPTIYTGGTGEVANLSTPTYSHCVQEDIGIWKKVDSRSDAYENNTGVRIADWIGINLESQRSYNLEAQLWYKLTTKTHWLCGNNRVPLYSQKVQDATYNQGAGQ